MKEYMQTGLIALVLVVVVVQLFQINSIKNEIFGNSITGNAVKTSGGSGAVDMTGWTEQEKMMYEHHGTLPSRLQGNVQASQQQTKQQTQTNRMVGGC